MNKIWPLAMLSLLAACSLPPKPLPARDDGSVQPEIASGSMDKPGWTFARHAVSAAHPLAVQAGVQILQEGGTALDAAIAVQMVLGLVEPQSSGIGGGAFLLHFDGQKLTAHDGRETAPAAARADLFLDETGKPLPFEQAMLSGRSVGVPGLVRMLEAAHRQHGALPWARLFDKAIALAEQGFAVGPRLHTLLQADPHLRKDPLAARLFYDAQGQAWPVGHVLRNPEYAHVLQRIAAEGSRALHEGPVAEAIVRRTQAPPRPGSLSLQDLRQYLPREREVLCFDHDGLSQAYRICGFPPPSSGQIAIGQIMGLLARTRPMGSETWRGEPPAEFVHHYTEASRLAFADRAQFVADPDFVPPPAGHWRSLLAPQYLQRRSLLIGPRPMQQAKPGQPGGWTTSWAPMPEQPEYGTSHISVVDAQGRAVAMTSSVEAGFGSRRMVSTDASRAGGFLLNNQLTDFSFVPADTGGRPVANRVEGGKRPRSSMSPTMVFDKASGQLQMVAGSPGGGMIIHYMTRLLLGTLQQGLDPQQTMRQPHFGTLDGTVLLEKGRWSSAIPRDLTGIGHHVHEMDMTSGLHVLQRARAGWFGAADPRREGIAGGQ